jgi:hypothetical protein
VLHLDDEAQLKNNIEKLFHLNSFSSYNYYKRQRRASEENSVWRRIMKTLFYAISVATVSSLLWLGQLNIVWADQSSEFKECIEQCDQKHPKRNQPGMTEQKSFHSGCVQKCRTKHLPTQKKQKD